MKRKHLAWIGAFAANVCFAGEPLFAECSVALKHAGYATLATQLQRTDTNAKNCQRLNNFEFLYTTEQNFYYCKFDGSTSEPCSKSDEFYRYPNLLLGSRFAGPNGKQFAVFLTSALSHGVYGTGVQIFYLTPKSRNPRGYEIVRLDGVGEINGRMSEAGELCSNLASDAFATESLNGKYTIIREGTAQVGIQFLLRHAQCSTGKVANRRVEYIWSGTKFGRSESVSVRSSHLAITS